MVLLLALLIVLQAGAVALDPDTLGQLTLAGTAAACAAAWLANWVMMSTVESRPPAALGLAFSRRGAADLIGGAAFGLAVIGGTVSILLATGWASWGPSPAPGWPSPHGTLYVTLLLLLAALFEELAVRGYPFQVLGRLAGGRVAIVGTAVVFALLHGANPGVGWTALTNTLLAGILLGLLYWRTWSLWMVTGVHFAWNWGMGVAVGLPVSGLGVGPSWAGLAVDGPELWTGGEYGPEGGLVLTLVTIAGIAWAARTSRLSRDPAVVALMPPLQDYVGAGTPTVVRAGAPVRSNRTESEDS